MNLQKIPHAFDARAILAEFPAGACQSHGSTFRAWDGFGNVGTGSSWEAAAASLRLARLERQREQLARDLAARARLGDRIATVILWAIVAIALAAWIAETTAIRGAVQ